MFYGVLKDHGIDADIKFNISTDGTGFLNTMATRTIEGTLDTFSVDTGSEVTYLGATSSGNGGEAVRAFRVNPGGTGNIIVKLDKTSGINTMEVFQEDAYGGSSAASVVTKWFLI